MNTLLLFGMVAFLLWYFYTQILTISIKTTISRELTESGEVAGADWMADLQDLRVLDLPVIPGTHHSGVLNPRNLHSRVLWGWAQCQSTSIESQLLFGVRFLDLRVRVFRNEVILSHRFLSDTSLNDALTTVKKFLSLHATETVLLLIRRDARHDFSVSDAVRLAEVIINSNVPIYGTIDDPGAHDVRMHFHQENLGLDYLLVSDLAGHVVIFADETDFVLPPGSLDVYNNFPSSENRPVYIPHISNTVLTYVDIWREPTVVDAQSKIEEYLTHRYARGRTDMSSFGGVALDSTFTLIGSIPDWPIRTNPELNLWFLKNLGLNWKHKVKKENPLGIVILDFATFENIQDLVSYNV